jgi:hypothetical protein
LQFSPIGSAGDRRAQIHRAGIASAHRRIDAATALGAPSLSWQPLTLARRAAADCQPVAEGIQ